MAIDVVIKQKMFGRKTMPLDVILGNNLSYGNFDVEQLIPGELGDAEFVAYNPQSIGRGFSVIWNPKETKQIVLRLPQPSTTQELADFYTAIERMVKYWDAKLIVDGAKVSLDAFTAGLPDMVEFNHKMICQFSRQVLDGVHDTLMLCSAMFPLVMGQEEASFFLDQPTAYAAWLHEKQCMDLYYESPHFNLDDGGVMGKFVLFQGTPSVFPNQPAAPFGAMDPRTNQPLECARWNVMIGIHGESAPLCEISYSEFLQLIPADKKSKFDATHFLLSEFTEQEIRALAASVKG